VPSTCQVRAWHRGGQPWSPLAVAWNAGARERWCQVSARYVPGTEEARAGRPALRPHLVRLPGPRQPRPRRRDGLGDDGAVREGMGRATDSSSVTLNRHRTDEPAHAPPRHPRLDSASPFLCSESGAHAWQPHENTRQTEFLAIVCELRCGSLAGDRRHERMEPEEMAATNRRFTQGI